MCAMNCGGSQHSLLRFLARAWSRGPFVVSCGNQRSQSRMVVAGRVGMWASRWGGLSTCPCGLMALELETVP